MSNLKLKSVVCAYPRLFTAEENRFTGKPEYSIQLRFYENNEEQMKQLEYVRAAMKDAAKNKWGGQAERMFKATQGSDNTRWLRHNEDDGYWFVNVKRRADRETGAPMVVGRRRELLSADMGLPRGGDIVNVNLNVWAYDSGNSRGFSSTLDGVQWVSEGEFAVGASAPVAKPQDFDVLDADSSSKDEGFDANDWI